MTAAALHEFEYHRDVPRTCPCMWLWEKPRWVLSRIAAGCPWHTKGET
jgi:hypothetical protein